MPGHGRRTNMLGLIPASCFKVFEQPGLPMLPGPVHGIFFCLPLLSRAGCTVCGKASVCVIFLSRQGCLLLSVFMSLLVLLCLGMASPASSSWAAPLESAAKVRTFASMCGLSSCFSCPTQTLTRICQGALPGEAVAPELCSLQPFFRFRPASATS